MNRKKTKTDTVLKRSKNEVVRATLGSYLKRRNYTTLDPQRPSEADVRLPYNSDFGHKAEVQLAQSREQMAITTAIENDVTRNNSILYSCINSDTTQVDQQFTKFKTWVNDLLATDCRTELTGLILPLFCHLYLEMLRGGNRQVAAKFLKRYQSTLAVEIVVPNAVSEVLEDLSHIATTQDINMRPIVKAFRSCKYLFRLSSKTMACLKKYLTVHGHVILFQVLQTWFDLEVPVTSNGRLEDDEDDKTESADTDIKPSFGGVDQPDSSNQRVADGVVDLDAKLRELQEAIRLIKEEPSPSFPLMLYTIVNSNNNVSSACISQSQRLMAAGCLSSEVRIYRIPGSRNLGQDSPIVTNNPVAHVKLACDEVLPPGQIQRTQCIGFQDSHCEALHGHSRAVYDVALVPEADAVVSVSADCSMRAWNMRDMSCAAVYRGHNYPIYSVDVSALSIYLATASHDRTARLWSLDRTFCLRIFAGHQQEVTVVKFHPNGSYLATASADKTVRLWSVADGKMVRVFPGHKGSVHALAFSRNGKYLATGGEDKRVRIWDLAEGGMLTELKGHTEPVVSLQWEPGSDGIAASSTDAVVRHWTINSSISSDNHGSDSLFCNTGCTSLLNLQYTHRNTLVCIGTL